MADYEAASRAIIEKRVQRDSGATKPRSLELQPRTDFAAGPKNFEHKFTTAPTWAVTGRRQNDTWGLAGRNRANPLDTAGKDGALLDLGRHA